MAMAILAWIVAIPLLGGLTGLRTFTPLAVLCWFAYVGHLDVEDTWGGWSAKLTVAVIVTILAVGELIGDKLPGVPNRTALLPLIARVCVGGLVGSLAATGLHGSVIEGALLGSISAFAGTFVGFHLRRYMVVENDVQDVWVALAEDALAIGLAVIAMGIVTG
jgi:uncharacterized membrane protein